MRRVPARYEAWMGSALDLLLAAVKRALAARSNPAVAFAFAPAGDGSVLVTRTLHDVGAPGQIVSTHERTWQPVEAEPARLDAWAEAFAQAWAGDDREATSFGDATPALLGRPELVTVADFARALADWELCALIDQQEPIGDADEERLRLAIGQLDFVAVGDLLAMAPALAAARGEGGFTPLHEAAAACVLEGWPTAGVRVLEVLLAHGADVHAAADDGRTPLHSARGPAVATLLAAGAALEARDDRGNTPLLAWAAEREGLEPMAALLARGADPAAVNDDGQSAADLARLRAEPEKLALLARYLPR